MFFSIFFLFLFSGRMKQIEVIRYGCFIDVSASYNQHSSTSSNLVFKQYNLYSYILIKLAYTYISNCPTQLECIHLFLIYISIIKTRQIYGHGNWPQRTYNIYKGIDRAPKLLHRLCLCVLKLLSISIDHHVTPFFSRLISVYVLYMQVRMAFSSLKSITCITLISSVHKHAYIIPYFFVDVILSRLCPTPLV